MENSTRILIADDHQMFIDGLRALFEGQTKYDVVAQAHNGIEAIEIINHVPIDNLITDLSMPEMGGIELITHTKKHHPQIKVLVLSMHNNRETIGEILMSEAEGYILKNTGKQELMLALDRINNHGTYYSNEVLSLMIEKMKYDDHHEKPYDALSRREMEVLNLIVKECTSEEIAESLYISKRTVDTHRINILQKTDSKTLVGLIKYAYRHGLISDE